MTKQPRQFHLKEWRKLKGVKAVHLAEALEIERESYYRSKGSGGRFP